MCEKVFGPQKPDVNGIVCTKNIPKILEILGHSIQNLIFIVQVRGNLMRSYPCAPVNMTVLFKNSSNSQVALAGWLQSKDLI